MMIAVSRNTAVEMILLICCCIVFGSFSYEIVVSTTQNGTIRYKITNKNRNNQKISIIYMYACKNACVHWDICENIYIFALSKEETIYDR